MNAPWVAMFQSCDLLLRGKPSPRRVYRACTDRIRNVSDNISFQIAGDLGVGGRVGRRFMTEIGIAARAGALAALASIKAQSVNR
jgi:hypothetical protein